MEAREFNLLDEPWVRVMRPNAQIEELSLTEALLNAQQYRGLGGELPTQDVAVLRLLLAVLHTVFSRVDENGVEAPLEERSDALERWSSLWELGRFPEAPIRDYLAKWHERFWLFDPEQPFYQVPEAEKGTSYGASKLNGEMSESSHKLKLFPVRTGESRGSLSYAEAARWLVTINGFDDSSTKVETGTGAGWLGRLGNVYACGDNLFETLLLNMTLLKDGHQLWEEENCPVWERPANRIVKKREIAVPDNQAALLTLQSRSLLLSRKDGRVVGYSSAGGDYFEDVGAFAEQMTLWYTVKGKPNQPFITIPRRHDPTRQMWRDFGLFVHQNKETHQFGVGQWINMLQRRGSLPHRCVCYQTTGIRYDGKGSSVIDVFSDHLDFNTELLTEQAVSWVEMIQRQIGQCEEAAGIIGYLSDSLCKAAGGDRVSKAQYAKERFFAEIDLPFRSWLLAIDPKDDSEEAERDRAERQWERTAYRIARRLGTEMVEDAGAVAYAGREISEKIKGKDEKVFYSSPKAFNVFNGQIKKCFKYEAAEEESH